MTLPQAPMRPVVDGRVAFGTYAGVCETTGLESFPVHKLRRLYQERGWQRFYVVDESLAVGGTLLDAGLGNAVVIWIVDRDRSRLLVEQQRLLPPTTLRRADRPGNRPRIGASFRDVTLAATQTDEGFIIAGQIGPLTLDLTLTQDGPGPITAICPVKGDSGITVTQKSTCLSASGVVDWQADSATLDGADAMLDFSHGVLPRETSWNWAIATGTTAGGTPVGVTLVDGFTDDLQNTVWLGDERRAVGDATVTSHDAGSWTAHTADGRVELSLDPDCVRHTAFDIGIAGIRTDQSVGSWHGTIDGHTVDLAGLGEDLWMKW